MINFVKGDIFQAKVDALVNPVNCVGVMGKGLALSFKNKFPKNYYSYQKACAENKVTMGEMFVFENENLNPKFIINFPTKIHWRNPSSKDYIVQGLNFLTKTIEQYSIESIAIPKIGCGLGGLPWEEVKPLIIDFSEKVLLEVKIIVFE